MAYVKKERLIHWEFIGRAWWGNSGVYCVQIVRSDRRRVWMAISGPKNLGVFFSLRKARDCCEEFVKRKRAEFMAESLRKSAAGE